MTSYSWTFPRKPRIELHLAEIMAKSGKRDGEKVKKDNFQTKKGPGSVVKAKDKRKKSNTKKVIFFKGINL